MSTTTVGRVTMRARINGFTLIEIMIAVVILGILVGISLPLYQDYVRDARRSEAKSMLHEVMQRQERHFTENNTYTKDLDGDLNYADPEPLTENGWYEIEARLGDSNSECDDLTECVAVVARPQDDQSNDKCGTLIMTAKGEKEVMNANAGADECW